MRCMRRQPGFSREPSRLRVLEHSAVGILREGKLLLELLGFRFFPFCISIIFCKWTKSCHDKHVHDRGWRAPKQTQEGRLGHVGLHSSAEARVGLWVTRPAWVSALAL